MKRAVAWAGAGLTVRRLVPIILFLAILAMATRQPTDTDTWWHLRSGQLMWQQGRVLRADPFSYTVAGAPWIDHGWLVQLGLWPLWQVAGLPGLALLLAMTVAAAFWLVYRQCEGGPFVAAFATLLGAIASSIVWAVRPQLASLLLAAILAYLLHRYKAGGNARWLWPVPLLVALWANSHGGFVVAFLLLGCYLAGETLNRLLGDDPAAAPVRPLLLATLVSLPAILLNPNTWQMIPYAYQTVSIGALQDFIQEWAAPNFHQLQFHPFIWLLLLSLAAMGLSPRRADWTDLALLGLFTYMGLLAVRNIALFALVAPPILSRHAVAAVNELALKPRLSWLGALTHSQPAIAPSRALGLLNLGLLNLVLLVLVLGAAGAKMGLELDRVDEPAVWGQGLPLEAADYLQSAGLPGRMFNSYNWGGYLIWRLYPDQPVFVDGRTDLYALNSQVLEDYSRVHWQRPGWQAIFDKYGIGYVVTERTGLLDVGLAGEPGWEQVHSDEVAVVYRRGEEEP